MPVLTAIAAPTHFAVMDGGPRSPPGHSTLMRPFLRAALTVMQPKPRGFL